MATASCNQDDRHKFLSRSPLVNEWSFCKRLHPWFTKLNVTLLIMLSRWIWKLKFTFFNSKQTHWFDRHYFAAKQSHKYYVPQSESSIWIAYLFIFSEMNLWEFSQQGENFSHIGDQNLIGCNFEPCHYVHMEKIKINLFGWWTQKCFSKRVQNPPQPLTCNCFM